MIGWLLQRLERRLDRTLNESLSARARLEALEGRSFRITVDGLDLDCVLAIEQGRLHVRQSGEDADAAVRGTPLDLLRLAGPDIASRVHGSGVSLTGRMHVAEEFWALLRLAVPEPEEELSRWVGDLAAYRVGSAARSAGAWLSRAVDALRLDTAEYLTEESGALPTRYEAEAFFRGVERLRDDVERAAERIERLAARAAAGASDAAHVEAAE